MRHALTQIPDGPPSDPDRYRRQATAQLHPEQDRRVGAQTPRSASAIPEPDPGVSLGTEGGNPLLLVNPDRQVLVRIVRVGGRPLDDDNLAAGCKELRDAIAAALGRRGDSASDGLAWKYCQEPGETPETRIEMTSSAANKSQRGKESNA